MYIGLVMIVEVSCVRGDVVSCGEHRCLAAVVVVGAVPAQVLPGAPAAVEREPSK